MMVGWVAMSPELRSADAVAPAEPPVATSLRLVWLVGLVYAVAAATHPGGSGRHLAAAVLTATTALGWGVWLMARHRHHLPASLAAIALLAVTGGALVVLHPIGVAVIGVAGVCAGSLLDVLPAAAVTVPGVLAAAIAVTVTGHQASVIGSAASGAVAGLVVGMGRRQSQQRVRQDAELKLAHQRAQLEFERAEVLAERNRLAREVHDVLAHTLSALSVQMEALGSLVDDGADAAEIGAVATRSRRLVSEGLEETRRAVRVLRDEPVDVLEQLARLAEDDRLELWVEGEPRPLGAATGLALVRAAQEAVTNARKHAVGAPVTIALVFAETSTRLTIDNRQTGASPLAATGTGYGLQGMRERLELVGGSLTAGPRGGSWCVRAEVPS
jgi:signal transduction histidine kinase